MAAPSLRALLMQGMSWVLLIVFPRALLGHPTTSNYKPNRLLQHPQQQHRSEQEVEEGADPSNLFGIQSGPANGNTDAGGMVFDSENNQLILVGTTQDTEYFQDSTTTNTDTNNPTPRNVDCFIATVQVPPGFPEVSEEEAAGSAYMAYMSSQDSKFHFSFSGQKRISTTSLDRCDLVARIAGEQHHDHYFVAGTVASGDTLDAISSLEPVIRETNVTYLDSGQQAKLDVGIPSQFFGDELTPTQIASGRLDTDIIIPAAMTSHGHDLYIAMIDRRMVLKGEDSSPNAADTFSQINLQFSKFELTEDPSQPLSLKFHIKYSTQIYEKRIDNNGNSHHVPASMFENENESELEHQANAVENEVEELEHQEDEYELNQYGLYDHHEYRFDGVLISAMEVVDIPGHEQPVLLVAGSAPGIRADNGTIQHPLMDRSNTFIGDWDGFVTKVNAQTGMVMEQADQSQYTTWTYRVETTPRRNDFVQSMCIPRLPHKTLSSNTYQPSEVYIVGTTQGVMEGEQEGGAFIIALRLDTFDVAWKKQIPGMNVHGLSCAAFVQEDPSSTEPLSTSFVYVAGEVHGSMVVEVRDPTSASGTRSEQTVGNGETDVWVAQFDAKNDGAINWVKQIGTGVQDRLAKTTNNPFADASRGEADVGDTGSGKGALTLDNEGHALIYGTTQGSLSRTKEPSNNFKDIFVLRLHKDDGTYHSVFSSSDTSGSEGPGIHNDPDREPSPDVNAKDPNHSFGGRERTMNYTAVVLLLLLPVVLTIIIVVGTRPAFQQNDREAPPPPMRTFPTEVEHFD